MKPFTVRIYQRWKSIKQPQQDSGLYPIKIQIVSKDENRKQKDIHTDVVCTRKVYEALFGDTSTATAHQMRDINKIRKAPENVEIKRKVEKVYYRYYDIVKDITRENRKNTGIIRLADVLSVGSTHKMVDKFKKTPFDKEMQTLEYWFERFLVSDEGQSLAKKNRGRIKSTKNNFCKYYKQGNWKTIKEYQNLKHTIVKYKDIDKTFLSNWQRWMETPELQKDSKRKTKKTIKGYADKDLKKVLKFITEIPRTLYKLEDIPIGRNKDQWTPPVAEKNEAKIPRYLDSEDLEKFKNYEPENEKEELAKDVWFLSYYLGGINCADLVNLRKSNIQKEHDLLVYYRNKNTKKPSVIPAKVPLRKEALELIEKYSVKGPSDIDWDNIPEAKATKLKRMYKMPAKDFMLQMVRSEAVSGVKGVFADTTGPSPSFLLNFHMYSADKKNTSDNLRTLVNNENHLKAIAKKLKIKTSLNYQMARHTLATNLMRNEAPTKMIQGIYGHSSDKSTENYLSGFETKEVKKVFDKI